MDQVLQEKLRQLTLELNSWKGKEIKEELKKRKIIR